MLTADRNSALHGPVALTDANNVFCYNGPARVEIRPGTYTLAALAAALWHAVLASGVVDPEGVLETNPFDFGLTLDKSIAAEGWGAVPLQDSPAASAAESPSIMYRQALSGKRSEPSDGKPVRLVCTGRGNFVPLNHHVQNRLIASCVYWTGLRLAFSLE